MPALECSSIAVIAARSIALAQFEKCSRIAAKWRLESMKFAANAAQPPEGGGWPSSTPEDREEHAWLSGAVASCGKEDTSYGEDSGHLNSYHPRACASASSGRAVHLLYTRDTVVEKDEPLGVRLLGGDHDEDMCLAIQFLENVFGKLVSVSTIRDIIEVEEVAVLTQMRFEWGSFQQWGSASRHKVSLVQALRLAFEDSIVASVVDFSPSFVL